jgi:lysophospholipase L1-like esterase
MAAGSAADGRAAGLRLRRLVLFAAIMAAQFGVFEAALRTWGSSEAAPSFQGLFEGDPEIGYRLKPGARVHFATSEFAADIAINEDGVRDDAPLAPKAAGEKRVVLLGDSLVLAVQVPFAQTFGELLERELNARRGPWRYRVINAGVQGYGPVEETLLFRALAERLQPDVVIQTIFVGNDAEEAVRSEPRLRGDLSAADALQDTAVTRLRRLVRRSMVLQILRLRAVSAADRFTGATAPPEPPLQSYAANPAPRIAQGIAITRECVAAVARLAAAHGAKTAIALMPARFQVDDADYGRLKEAVAGAGGELVRDAATRRFADGLGDVGLPIVDLLPPLRGALPGPDLFYQETVHLTPRGHQVVAHALAAFLEREGLAPGRERLAGTAR